MNGSPSAVSVFMFERSSKNLVTSWSHDEDTCSSDETAYGRKIAKTIIKYSDLE